MSKVLNTAAALAVLFAAPIQAATIAIDMSGSLIAGTGVQQSTVLGAPGAGDLAVGDAFEASFEIETDASSNILPNTGQTRYFVLGGSVTIDGVTIPVAPASGFITIGDTGGVNPDRLNIFATFDNANVNPDLRLSSFSMTFTDPTQAALDNQDLTVDNLNAFDEPLSTVLHFLNPTEDVPGGYLEGEALLRAYIDIDSYSATLLDDGTSAVPNDPAPIPLPAGAPLLLAGLGALWVVRRKRAA